LSQIETGMGDCHFPPPFPRFPDCNIPPDGIDHRCRPSSVKTSSQGLVGLLKAWVGRNPNVPPRESAVSFSFKTHEQKNRRSSLPWP